MEALYGIFIILLIGALAYGIHQSNMRRREKGEILPEEKVDRMP